LFQQNASGLANRRKRSAFASSGSHPGSWPRLVTRQHSAFRFLPQAKQLACFGRNLKTASRRFKIQCALLRNRSQVPSSPSRTWTRDPASRFRLLAEHRSGFRFLTWAKQLAHFGRNKKTAFQRFF
jgi:hypothetical protein